MRRTFARERFDVRTLAHPFVDADEYLYAAGELLRVNGAQRPRERARATVTTTTAASNGACRSAVIVYA